MQITVQTYGGLCPKFDSNLSVQTAPVGSGFVDAILAAALLEDESDQLPSRIMEPEFDLVLSVNSRSFWDGEEELRTPTKEELLETSEEQLKELYMRCALFGKLSHQLDVWSFLSRCVVVGALYEKCRFINAKETCARVFQISPSTAKNQYHVTKNKFFMGAKWQMFTTLPSAKCVYYTLWDVNDQVLQKFYDRGDLNAETGLAEAKKLHLIAKRLDSADSGACWEDDEEGEDSTKTDPDPEETEATEPDLPAGEQVEAANPETARSDRSVKYHPQFVSTTRDTDAQETEPDLPSVSATPEPEQQLRDFISGLIEQYGKTLVLKVLREFLD